MRQELCRVPRLIDLFMANGDPVLAENWVVPRALRGETGTNAEYTIRRKDTGETWIGSYTFSPFVTRMVQLRAP